MIHPCLDQVVEVSGSRAVVSTSLPLPSSTDQCSTAGGLLLLLVQERVDGWPGSRGEGGGEMCTEVGPTRIWKRIRIDINCKCTYVGNCYD